VLDALAAEATAARVEVQREAHLAQSHVAHDVKLWDDVHKLDCKLCDLLDVVREGVEALHKMNGELAVNIVQVYNVNGPVHCVQRFEQQELHVTLASVDQRKTEVRAGDRHTVHPSGG
jgi:hypothetical protein